jgi:hypothetical protein
MVSNTCKNVSPGAQEAWHSQLGSYLRRLSYLFDPALTLNLALNLLPNPNLHPSLNPLLGDHRQSLIP